MFESFNNASEMALFYKEESLNFMWQDKYNNDINKILSSKTFKLGDFILKIPKYIKYNFLRK